MSWEWTGWDIDAFRHSANREVGNFFSPLADMLGMDQGDINRFYNDLSNIPIIGDVVKWNDNAQYMEDYMRNRGLSWADVRYPSRINAGTGNLVGAVRSGANFVSRNIFSLYD